MTATGPTDDALREKVAQAIRDSNGTPEALEWWRKHPQLVPAHVYADAAIVAVRADSADTVQPDLNSDQGNSSNGAETCIAVPRELLERIEKRLSYAMMAAVARDASDEALDAIVDDQKAVRALLAGETP